MTTTLTIGGLVFMALAWTFVIGLLAFCAKKIVETGRQVRRLVASPQQGRRDKGRAGGRDRTSPC